MIQYLRNLIALPLLGKDLIERAARPRTYILRIVFGFLFIGLLWLEFRKSQQYFGGSSIYALLGAGANIFNGVVSLLLCAIIIFQPAIMAGAITHEKERETLPLLLLADMSPWKLLLQKYMSGLLPMFTLLLYGLPLGAIAYAYGGVTPGKMLGAALVLGGAWLQIGAFALLCSSWFRTTTSATVAAYVAGAIFIFGTDYGLWIYQEKMSIRIYRGLGKDGGQVRLSPVIVHQQITTINADPFLSRFPGRFAWTAAKPLYTSAAVFVLLARACLLRRALAPSSTSARRLFVGLDSVFESVNSRFGGGAIFRGKSHTLPEIHPILWRETSRGILGRPSHLIRLGMGLFITVCAVLTLLLLVNSFSLFPSNAKFMMDALIVIGSLAIAALATDSLGRERTQQTLEVLLTTPIEPRQLVKQKLAAARRLGWIFLFNILAIAALRLVLLYEYPTRGRGSTTPDSEVFRGQYHIFYAVCLVISLPVLFGIIRWFSMWLSIRIRNRGRALLVCLGVFALWSTVPHIINNFWRPSTLRGERFRDTAIAVSPYSILVLSEHGAFAATFPEHPYPKTDWRITRRATQSSVIMRAVALLAIQVGFLLTFRTLSLRAADRHLRETAL